MHNIPFIMNDYAFHPKSYKLTSLQQQLKYGHYRNCSKIVTTA